MSETNKCRKGCGACCIVPSISSSIPGMPEGKPAGIRCVQLTEDNLCRLFGKKNRPTICNEYTPTSEFCGRTTEEAMHALSILEEATRD
ncbi:MAG: YkgJ family cysteine cluster protein [Spirochaetales bacterium]|nr:YkgJ family cysteine cluster protein [Spirochaetales bacterium]